MLSPTTTTICSSQEFPPPPTPTPPPLPPPPPPPRSSSIRGGNAGGSVGGHQKQQQAHHHQIHHLPHYPVEFHANQKDRSLSNHGTNHLPPTTSTSSFLTSGGRQVDGQLHDSSSSSPQRRNLINGAGGSSNSCVSGNNGTVKFVFNPPSSSSSITSPPSPPSTNLSLSSSSSSSSKTHLGMTKNHPHPTHQPNCYDNNSIINKKNEHNNSNFSHNNNPNYSYRSSSHHPFNRSSRTTAHQSGQSNGKSASASLVVDVMNSSSSSSPPTVTSSSSFALLDSLRKEFSSSTSSLSQRNYQYLSKLRQQGSSLTSLTTTTNSTHVVKSSRVERPRRQHAVLHCPEASIVSASSSISSSSASSSSSEYGFILPPGQRDVVRCRASLPSSVASPSSSSSCVSSASSSGESDESLSLITGKSSSSWSTSNGVTVCGPLSTTRVQQATTSSSPIGHAFHVNGRRMSKNPPPSCLSSSNGLERKTIITTSCSKGTTSLDSLAAKKNSPLHVDHHENANQEDKKQLPGEESPISSTCESPPPPLPPKLFHLYRGGGEQPLTTNYHGHHHPRQQQVSPQSQLSPSPKEVTFCLPAKNLTSPSSSSLSPQQQQPSHLNEWNSNHPSSSEKEKTGNNKEVQMNYSRKNNNHNHQNNNINQSVIENRHSPPHPYRLHHHYPLGNPHENGGPPHEWHQGDEEIFHGQKDDGDDDEIGDGDRDGEKEGEEEDSPSSFVVTATPATVVSPPCPDYHLEMRNIKNSREEASTSQTRGEEFEDKGNSRQEIASGQEVPLLPKEGHLPNQRSEVEVKGAESVRKSSATRDDKESSTEQDDHNDDHLRQKEEDRRKTNDGQEDKDLLDNKREGKSSSPSSCVSSLSSMTIPTTSQSSAYSTSPLRRISISSSISHLTDRVDLLTIEKMSLTNDWEENEARGLHVLSRLRTVNNALLSPVELDKLTNHSHEVDKVCQLVISLRTRLRNVEKQENNLHSSTDSLDNLLQESIIPSSPNSTLSPNSRRDKLTQQLKEALDLKVLIEERTESLSSRLLSKEAIDPKDRRDYLDYVKNKFAIRFRLQDIEEEISYLQWEKQKRESS